MLSYLIGLPYLALPIGVLLLVLGLRGRLVSDHPFCRRCGYDLYGHDGPQTCPECGRDLTRRRAIRLGRRRARRWLIASGIALPILVTGVAAMSVLQELRVIDLNRLKPYAWLKREASREDGGKAWIELGCRYDLGDISEAQVTELAELAVVAQERAGDWTAGWAGEFLQSAWADGFVTDDQLRQYLELSALPEPTTLSEATRCGATFGYDTHIPLGFMRNGPIVVATWVERVETAGRQLRHQPARWDPVEIWQLDVENTGVVWVPDDLDVEGGHLEVTVYSRTVALPSDAASAWLGQGSPVSGFAQLTGILHDWTIQTSHQLDLLEADETPMFETERLPEPEAMQWKVCDYTGLWRDRNGVLHPNPLYNAVAPTPVVSFPIDVYWRADDREWLVESFTCGRSENRQYFLADLVGFPRDVTEVDVILRGNPELADLHPGLMNIWVGELVIEDVPLYWPEE